jgi:hypothetical protein
MKLPGTRRSLEENIEAHEKNVLIPHIEEASYVEPEELEGIFSDGEHAGNKKRLFLKGLVIVAGGLFATALFPKRADALVLGSNPGTSIIGLKDASNTRINPTKLEGNSVIKKTVVLTASGTVHTPSSGKKIRLYTSKFSLDTTMASISFRFTAGGTDHEKYLAPRTGGLYGTNNHPNFVEGGVNEVLYCAIDGTGNVQINIDYLEV